jgi:hypothetical protein
MLQQFVYIITIECGRLSNSRQLPGMLLWTGRRLLHVQYPITELNLLLC